MSAVNNYNLVPRSTPIPRNGTHISGGESHTLRCTHGSLLISLIDRIQSITLSFLDVNLKVYPNAAWRGINPYEIFIPRRFCPLCIPRICTITVKEQEAGCSEGQGFKPVMRTISWDKSEAFWTMFKIFGWPRRNWYVNWNRSLQIV